jgi:hypothetical protein
MESSPHTVEVIGLKSKMVTFHWYKDSSTCVLRNDFWPMSLLSTRQALIDFMLVGHFLLLDLATVCWTFNIIWVLCCYGLSSHWTFYLLDVLSLNFQLFGVYYIWVLSFTSHYGLGRVYLKLCICFLATAATQLNTPDLSTSKTSDNKSWRFSYLRS